MTQLGLFDEPVQAIAPPAQARMALPEPELTPAFEATGKQIVTLGGRDYRHHRDCGEFVWLAALDAGIGGPFYWMRAEELRPKASQFVPVSSQADCVRTAQKRLASLPLNGPEYMDALGEMARAMREGRDV